MKISLVMEALTGAFVTDVKRARSSFERDMKRMQREAQEAGRALGLALVAGATAAAAALKTVTDEADKLGEMSERLGLSTEAFTSMGYAAQMSGIEIEKFSTANRNLGLRLEKNEELFASLGVSTRGADGAFRSTTDIIRDLADAFAAMPEGIEQSRIAADIFGAKLGNDMIPLLNRGSEGISQMERDAATLGFTLSGETAGAAGELNDQLDRLKIIATAVIRQGIGPANDALKVMALFAIAVTTRVKQLGATIGFLGQNLQNMERSVNAIDALPTPMEALGIAIDEGPTAALARMNEAIADVNSSTVGLAAGAVQNFATLQAAIADIEREGQDLAEAYSRTTANGAATGGVPAIGAGGSTGAAAVGPQEAKEDRDRADAKRLLADAIRAEADARLEAKLAMQDARREEAEYYEQMLSDMEFELELMKMSNVEAQTAIQLRGASAEAVRKYGDELAALNKRMEEERATIEQMDGLRYATQGLFEDLISGSKSAKDAFQDFANSVIANIVRMIAQKMVERLFGDFGSTGSGTSGGGFATAIFGALFGGGRAVGGTVSPGKMYRVNEDGPEMLSVGGRDYLMMGGNTGMVTPNSRLGRSVSQNITFMLPGRIDTRTQAQIAADAGRASQRAMARA